MDSGHRAGKIQQRRRKKRHWRSLGIAAAAVAAIVLCGSAAFEGMRILGKHRLQESTAQQPSQHVITYDGKNYVYREDMITILCMGIDIRQINLDEWSAEDERMAEYQAQQDILAEGGMIPEEELIDFKDLEYTKRRTGQADAIFLLAVDTKADTLDIIAIPRDIMAPVKQYSLEGEYTGTKTMQITLQHAYGKDARMGGELMKEAVSELFYQLPIHGYCSINMLAVPIINDAVGGVTVTVEEDLTQLNPKFEEGAVLHLMGEDAMDFVGRRDITMPWSSLTRISRQRQYVTAFFPAAKEAVKKDPGLPLSLLGELSDYISTDISAEEIAYLAPEALECGFSQENLHVVQVDATMGERYEEYYVKEQELYELVLEVFYEEVEDLE